MPRRRVEPARAARAETDAVPLDRFLAEQGFATPASVALARAAIVAAGLSSRPDRPNIHPTKLPAIEKLLATRFVRVCAGCHAGAEPAAGLALDLPLETLATRLREPSIQSPSHMPLVTPGQIGL